MVGRFYETATGHPEKRSAPAAQRNREPIAEVLQDWLPESGLVLEIASGTGEHAAHFARRFPRLEWQPTDCNEGALRSIAAWRADEDLPNLRVPMALDAGGTDWPVEKADAVLSLNMVHISPWSVALGLIAGASTVLPPGGPLILYGPWLKEEIATAPSNLAFDADLKARNPEWGLRRVEDFAAGAAGKGMELAEWRRMPANNLMLLFTKRG